MRLFEGRFFIGWQEFVIVFMGGTHVIAAVDSLHPSKTKVVFRGSYSDCLEERERMEVEHRVNLL